MKHYINNHLRLVVRYNEDENTDGTKQFEGARIVGFEVKLFKLCVICLITTIKMLQVDPVSIKHKWQSGSDWNDEKPPTLNTCATVNV